MEEIITLGEFECKSLLTHKETEILRDPSGILTVFGVIEYPRLLAFSKESHFKKYSSKGRITNSNYSF